MRSVRLACVVVPLFPLAARLRSEPELAREALAIFDGNGSQAHLVAATRPARRAGLKVGLTLHQARALLPKLVVRARDADCERSAQEALVEAAEAISPRVEDAGEGVAFLDLSGLERHFPGESFEPRVGQAILEIAARTDLPVRVGIASSKLTARLAADLPNSPTVVSEGEEAAFLAPFPLQHLSPELHVAHALQRWGVRSLGDLARLSAAEVRSRLGKTGHELHAIARGIDPRPLLPRQPPLHFSEAMSLDWPLVALEPFLFLARTALERLCRRLETQGLAAQRLEVELRLEPEGFYQRSLELPAPTHDAKTLLTLIRLELEARPPGAAVVGFRFISHPDRPREAQLTLFGPTALSPDRLGTTLARLFALLGPERVGAPGLVDGHRPERFALVPFAPPPPPPVRRSPPRGQGLLSVRVLRPPIPVEVLLHDPAPQPASGAEPASPRLLAVEPKAAAAAGKRPEVRGRVRVASGPWKLEEEWWSQAPVERDYWDVELANGGLYRLYQDHANGEWFVDGIYD